MRKIVSFLVALLMTLGLLVLPVKPAEAHNFDGWSQYYCIKHRPSNTDVIHSWPYAYGPGFVGYWCWARSKSSSASWQYWVEVYGGAGSPYSVRPWQYQPCWEVGCGSAGHN